VAGTNGIHGDRSAVRVEDLAKDLSSGSSRWALFIGAGLSAAVGVPGWETFLRETAKTLGVPCPPSIPEDLYPKIAQKCLDAAANPDVFYDLVSNAFCSDEPKPLEMHRQLLELPFDLFVTTNFDCLIPFLHQTQLAGVPAPRELAYPNIPVVEMNGKRLVLLHGWCRCVHPGDPSVDSDIVLTENGYDEGYRAPGAPLPRVLDALFRDFRVLMVGFSLSDFPIRVALNEIMATERYSSRPLSASGPAKRYAILPTEISGNDDDMLDLSTRFDAFDFEPIFYFNPPRGNHENLAKVIARLHELTVPPEQIVV
jgi:SIR2-like domain